MRLGKAALAASLAIGGVGLFAAAAPAQVPAVQAQGRTLNLNRDEHLALVALQAAAAGADRAAQDSALAAARAAAQSADARFGLAYYQLQIGLARQDLQMQAQAVDALAGSNLEPAEMAPLLAHQAARAFSAGDWQRTDRLLARAIELQPNNAVLLADYAQLKSRQRDNQAAAQLLQRALAAQEATGQRAPESWYRRAAAIAFDSRQAAQGIALSRALVAAYPTPLNWRDALLNYRALAAADPALSLDVLRTMRATQALTGERDYLALAQALTEATLPGEVKAVLDEGVSRGALDANEPVVRQQLAAVNARATQARSGLARLRTQALAGSGSLVRTAADTHFGLGQYAQAAELYRAALQTGGEDPNLVNSRLGMALALAGQRAEAEAALRAVTGPRADLAAFWLVQLAQPTR
jgi:tetratricopeptide (TPR) repeat protein